MSNIIDKNVDTDELMEEFDSDASRVRDPKGVAKIVVGVLTILMSLFHLYTAGAGTLIAMRQRSIHLVFAFVIGFLTYPGFRSKDKDKIHPLDVILAVLSGIVWGYIFINAEAIVHKGGNLNTVDYVFGLMAMLLTLEVTRRVVGPELPIVTIVFLLFAYFGRYMPGLLAHRGFSVERIVSHMYMTTEGILGTPVGVSATFVFMFILFGSFLEQTGVGEFFIEFAYALTGSTRSGPAMTSVVSSGLMGSVSGSSVANTVTTGAFTIPLMKSVGYEPHFAGAVEATASTGGQIMPPVMGAAAFIMADFTGFAYVDIVKAAIIPALLYYFAVGTMVHLEACKLGLKGESKENLPKLGNIFKTKGYLVLPLVAIVVMLVNHVTPTRSALIAIIAATVVAGVASMIKKDGSFDFRSIIVALEAGAKGAIGVACACACAGMIVGVVTLTGFGLKIADIIVAVSGGNLILTLMMTMVTSIILGMGLPTTAKYIVLATMAVPAITKLGVNLMSAHLFILYFGVVADVTPPVALAAYAGAGIAGANSMRTGVTAFKLAIGAFIIPFIFVLEPNLIMIESVNAGVIQWTSLAHTLPNVVTAILGTVLLASSMEGYFFDHSSMLERVIMLIGALGLLIPGAVSDIIGIVILVLLGAIQIKRKEKTTVNASL